ncbi:MAG: peptidoglycan-binding protein [Planctomycetota bacterium]
MSPSPDDDFSQRLAKAMGKSQTPQQEPAEQAQRAATSESAAPEQPAATTERSQESEEEQVESSGPVGQGDHAVRQGECVSSIARDTGHFWETIWNEPANSELREARQDPHVLRPEDRVTIPELRPKQESIAPEMRHRFVRRGEPEIFHVRVLREDEARGNEPYTLDIDGEQRTGTTDADGDVRCPIPGNARKAVLTVGPEDDEQTFEMELGNINPINTTNGVQARLNNLGFDCGPEDDIYGPRTRAALEAFQEKHGLEQTGKPDEQTRQKLREVYGV